MSQELIGPITGDSAEITNPNYGEKDPYSGQIDNHRWVPNPNDPPPTPHTWPQPESSPTETGD